MGPETSLWNTLKKQLPNDVFAERIENRQGGGFPDVFLCREGHIQLIELKVPQSFPKPVGQLNGGGILLSRNFLRPSQVAFMVRAYRCKCAISILARNKTTKNISILTPVRWQNLASPADHGPGIYLLESLKTASWPEVLAALRLD